MRTQVQTFLWLLFLGVNGGGLPAQAKEGTVTVLAINDVYRIAGVSGGQAGNLARVRTLRRELEADDPQVLVVHAGDLLFPSLLSRTYQGEQMIDVLNVLDGDEQAFDPRLFITFGNHEFDKSKAKHAALLKSRVVQSQFHWVNANVRFARGGDGREFLDLPNHHPGRIVEANGIKVGIFGLTTDVKIPKYVRRIENPVDSARTISASLRKQGAELVIAVTHLQAATDRKILKTLGAAGPDVIFGGHEHFRQQDIVDGRKVIKADADAVTATVARVRPNKNGPPSVEFEFRRLDTTVQPDPQVRALVNKWIERHDKEFCRDEFKLPPGCLAEPAGYTRVTLTGEELQIRSVESNLGNWIADQARAAYADAGAQIAFTNSGGLRLNYDIPAGSITRRQIVELFAYPAPVQLIEIDGATLQKVIDRAITGWPGVGHWLQISGFAFRFDSNKKTATDLSLLTEQGPRAIRPAEKLRAAVNRYLIDPQGDQDGFRMLNLKQVVDSRTPPDLKDLVLEGLEAAGERGIAPQRAGRICDIAQGGPCLLARER